MKKRILIAFTALVVLGIVCGTYLAETRSIHTFDSSHRFVRSAAIPSRDITSFTLVNAFYDAEVDMYQIRLRQRGDVDIEKLVRNNPAHIITSDGTFESTTLMRASSLWGRDILLFFWNVPYAASAQFELAGESCMLAL